MLTVTETITRPLDTTERLALDTSEVCEAYCAAMVAGDRQNALEYAKIIMLQAMSMGRWSFPQFPQPVENSKSQKDKKMTFWEIWKTEKT